MEDIFMRRKKRKKNTIYLFVIIILACILTLICYEGKIFDSNKPNDNDTTNNPKPDNKTDKPTTKPSETKDPYLMYRKCLNFKLENGPRYIAYKENHESYDYEKVVNHVNIGLDKEFYSYIKDADTSKGILLLMNKYLKLSENYEPDDLVALSYHNGYTYYLRSEAAEAYEELSSAALLDNVIVYPFSAYRSYDTQNTLYTRYKERDGEEKADTYSARPGFSEHQLGLAIDIRSNTLTDNLTNNDYEWMLDNSYKYGFIVRYPKGKQHITQFMEEPWHLRYLGVELATKVHDSGLTYDEYYDLYMK